MKDRSRLSAGAWLFGLAGLVPLAAQAEGSWYVGAGAGLNLVEEQTFDIYGAGLLGLGVDEGARISKAKFSEGWLGGLNAGYAFDGGLRAELDFNYRSNGFDKLDREPVLLFPGGKTKDVGGKETLMAGLFNLWYDLKLGEQWRPYLGGGIGYGKLKVDSSHWDNTDLDGDSDSVMAYQGGAGLAFVYDAHWSTSLDYRYIATDRGSFDILPNVPDTMVKAKYRAHSLMLGVQYRFAAPPPPPAPEPPPAVIAPAAPPPPPPPPPCSAGATGEAVSLEGCRTGDSLVLHGVNFEFDRDTLTPDAKVILDQVAGELTKHASIKVALNGHTDSRGGDSYNQKLSEARAQSVLRYLVSKDIAADRMSAQGFGETMPIADNNTDEGREQNRRVELKVVEAGTPAPMAELAPVAPEPVAAEAAPEAAPAPAPAP